jgi:NAD(P)-dependent dehydrogenase (short-subunit alcohol dehydrogenase family)
MDNQLLHNRNVLVTGAGANIGRSIAIEMAKQGANVFFTDLVAERVQAVRGELGAYAVRLQGYQSDVSRPDDVDTLCRRLAEAGVTIDILVNNVGVHLGANTLLQLTLEDVRASFDTNVFGPLYLTRRLTKCMVEHKITGCIIFISSIHQWELRRLLSYSASKAALGMIIKELAVDLAPFGIRVNGIAPGWVAEDSGGNPRPHRWAMLHGSSIKPCYIGRAAVYLASDYFSKFTTGTVLKIDAGLSLGNHLVYSEMPS